MRPKYLVHATEEVIIAVRRHAQHGSWLCHYCSCSAAARSSETLDKLELLLISEPKYGL